MTTACVAPETNLYLFPDGELRACCYNSSALGHVGQQGLLSVWRGATRRNLVDRLRAQDFSGGCQGCAHQIALEGRAASYPATFDRLETLAPEQQEWPRRIEFNLSNTCNLQCIQCNGNLSSSIRYHREGLPPLRSPYGERFFDELRQFLPHIRVAQFAGGEPFLAAENYRVWELLDELNPTAECTVVTNATQWNDRVRGVVERRRMNIVFSLDAIGATTYESVRLGARASSVLANVEHFRSVAGSTGSSTAVNHCLMPQNYREFPQVLLYAEERAMPVQVSVVRDPRSCSIAALPTDQIVRIHDYLRSCEDAVLPNLELNAATWRREVARLADWAGADVGGRTRAVASWDSTTLLDFPVVVAAGSATPFDEVEVSEQLLAEAPDTELLSMEVGPDDRIRNASASMAELVGRPVGDLVGRPVGLVSELVAAALGAMEDYEVVASSEDRRDARARFEGARARIVMGVVRDDVGVAHAGHVIVSLRRAPAPVTIRPMHRDS